MLVLVCDRSLVIAGFVVYAGLRFRFIVGVIRTVVLIISLICFPWKIFLVSRIVLYGSPTKNFF